MKILFVCTGNTCRSPMAQAIFEAMGGEAISRGVQVPFPSSACENAKKAVLKYGGDLSEHISRQITLSDIENADVVITMTAGHRDFLRNAVKDKEIITLAEFAGEYNDVADPYGGDELVYEKCAAQIYDYLKKGRERALIIKEAQESNAAFIEECERTVFSDGWSMNSVLGAIKRSQVLVAQTGGKLSGYCIFMNAADEGEILRIAVPDNMRKKGIGRKLLEKALDSMKERGVMTVYLEVRRSNEAAIALYKSSGFKESGVRAKYYDNGEDALIFNLDLKERL